MKGLGWSKTMELRTKIYCYIINCLDSLQGGTTQTHAQSFDTKYILHKGIEPWLIPFALSRQGHSCSGSFILNPVEQFPIPTAVLCSKYCNIRLFLYVVLTWAFGNFSPVWILRLGQTFVQAQNEMQIWGDGKLCKWHIPEWGYTSLYIIQNIIFHRTLFRSLICCSIYPYWERVFIGSFSMIDNICSN